LIRTSPTPTPPFQPQGGPAHEERWKRATRLLSAKLVAQRGESETAVAQRVKQHLSPAVWERLFEHQRRGVAYVLRIGGRALLADPTGSGKTVTVGVRVGVQGLSVRG